MKEIIKKLVPYTPPKSISELKKEFSLNHIAKLSANENPYGTSPKVAKSVIDAVPQNENYYPDGNASELRSLIANKLSINVDQISFGCGLDEIIAVISRVFLTPNDEIIVSNPTFSEYELNAEIEGAKTVKVPVNSNTGSNNLSKMLQAITSKTKIIWICNPNNPTGGYNSTSELRKFIQQVPNDILVVIDEAYIDFVTVDGPASAIELLNEFQNVSIMRTFSKAYGLASYRVGYVISSSKNTKYLESVRLPYNLNQLSQVAAIAALKDQSFLKSVVVKNAEERKKWEQFLQKNSIDFYPSQTNFIYFKIKNSSAIEHALLKKGYQIKSYSPTDWFRITIGTKEENQEIQSIIKKYK